MEEHWSKKIFLLKAKMPCIMVFPKIRILIKMCISKIKMNRYIPTQLTLIL